MTTSQDRFLSTASALNAVPEPAQSSDRRHRITLISGEGIGREATAAAVRTVEATGADIIWEDVSMNTRAVSGCGQPVPMNVIEAIRKNGVALKGPAWVPGANFEQNFNISLRQQLSLFIHFRPIRSIPGLESTRAIEPIDLAMFQENLEGVYSRMKQLGALGIPRSLDIVSRNSFLRIADAAFAFARRERKARVTAIHWSQSRREQLFLDCSRQTAKSFHDIRYDELSAGEAEEQLSAQPDEFDVTILAPSDLGNSLADRYAVHAGGVNLVPCVDMGDSCAVFSGSCMSPGGDEKTNKVNPAGMIRTAALLLRHIGEADAAYRLEQALYAVYAEGKMLISDVGGRASTAGFTDAIIAEITDHATSRLQ